MKVSCKQCWCWKMNEPGHGAVPDRGSCHRHPTTVDGLGGDHGCWDGISGFSRGVDELNVFYTLQTVLLNVAEAIESVATEKKEKNRQEG